MSSCPHCGDANPGTGAFCVRCGRALPTDSGPRIVRQKDLADSGAGQNLQAQELAKKARSAATTLFALCILHALGAGLFIFLGTRAGSNSGFNPAGPNAPAMSGDDLIIAGAVVGVVSIIFLALGFWARRSPLPAAITGLTLYVTLLLADAAVDPTQLARGIILKVIIILFLSRAIRAGFQHRALVRKMNAA